MSETNKLEPKTIYSNTMELPILICPYCGRTSCLSINATMRVTHRGTLDPKPFRSSKVFCEACNEEFDYTIRPIVIRSELLRANFEHILVELKPKEYKESEGSEPEKEGGKSIGNKD